MVSTAKITSQLFSLTEYQHEMLYLCTVIYGLSMPISKLEVMFNDYLILNSKGKQLIGSSVVFYTMMIGCDAVVLVMKAESYWLIIGTVFSDIVTVAYYLLACNMYKCIHRPDFKIIKEMIKTGVYVWIEKITSAIAYMGCSMFASRLGTFDYAIHGVASAIAEATEEVTNCWYTNQVIKLKRCTAENKKRTFWFEARRTILPAIGVSLALVIVMTIPMKGSLPIAKTCKFIALYQSQIIGLWLYENHRGLCINLGCTKYMVSNAILGITMRFVLCTMKGVSI